MLKITVNKQGTYSDSEPEAFQIEQQGENWWIDQQLFQGDIVSITDRHFHVIWENKSYNLEVVEANPAEKTFQIRINGQLYHTAAKDQIDLLLEGMGLQQQASHKMNHVKAPMPGLIQSIAVQEGEQVQKGDILLVLVAMKMENMIKAAGDGTVKTIKVCAGETVEKNQVLLEFQ